MWCLSEKSALTSWDTLGIDFKDNMSLSINTMMSSFRDMIDEWGGPQRMAADIGASVWAVRKWYQRDSIPSEWWIAIEAASARHDQPIAVKYLAEISARKLQETSHGLDRVATADADGGPSDSGPALSCEAAE